MAERIPLFNSSGTVRECASSDKSTIPYYGSIIEDGFADRTESTMSFTDGTRTFSIQPVSASYEFWSNASRFIKTGTDSVVISNTEGIWYIYFDDSGVLTATQTFNAYIITKWAYVAALYWDATNAKHIYLGEERHGRQLDSATHDYLHNTREAQIGRRPLGFSLTVTPDGSGSLNASAELGYIGGDIYDEDIKQTYSTVSVPAQIPVFYRSGTTWRRKTADNYPLLYNMAGSNGRADYNSISGGSGSLVEVSNGSYLWGHFYVTNDSTQPVITIPGQAEYSTKGLATNGLTGEINSLYQVGLPFSEFYLIGSVLIRTSNTYSNTPKSILTADANGNAYNDWRNSGQIPGGGATATAWGGIAGTLSDQTDLQAALDAQDPLTTKGDLFTYSTANARLAVGSDESLLIADSSQTTGQRWGNSINAEVYLKSDSAGLYKRNNGFITYTVEHFEGTSLPSGWSWINDPTGTNGTKTVADSLFHLTADDSLAKAFFYKSITGYLSKTGQILLMGESNFECGLRIDDGSDNNYVELYLEYESAGKVRVYKRRRLAAGAVVETAMVTGLPIGMWGCDMLTGGSAGNWSISYRIFNRETAKIPIYISQDTGYTFTPSRFGIFATKFDTGPSRGSYIDWFYSSFT